jgi:hypothetical protein
MLTTGRSILVIATLLAPLLAGCMELSEAGPSGGVIQFPSNIVDGLKLASAHCAQYERNAFLVDQDLFETITFACIGR